MEDSILKMFMEMGTTGGFLVYLYFRNGKQERSMSALTESVNRNTKVLIKVAQKHGYMTEADELIEK